MHIEIGIIDPVRIAAANATALSLFLAQTPALIREPAVIIKTAAAALVFSVLMQSWHLPVGPSELHLIGATTIYLLFGFRATMMGFGLGLALQTLMEPQDLLHIGVNSLSLMVPLMAVHLSYGRRLFGQGVADRFTFARVLRLDAIYYAGVATMVGFWLLLSNAATPFADWARWAIAYMPVFALEAMITFAAVTLFGRKRNLPMLQRFSELGRLNFAR